MGKKKEPPTEHRTKTTKETRKLRVQLTQEELLAAGRKLAEEVRALTQWEAEAKSSASQYKAKIDEIKAKIAGTQILVNDGYELRSVPCLNVLDYTAVKCIVTREDTGEIIEDRKLTEDEKQSTLPFDEDKEKEAAQADHRSEY